MKLTGLLVFEYLYLLFSEGAGLFLYHPAPRRGVLATLHRDYYVRVACLAPLPVGSGLLVRMIWVRVVEAHDIHGARARHLVDEVEFLRIDYVPVVRPVGVDVIGPVGLEDLPLAAVVRADQHAA